MLIECSNIKKSFQGIDLLTDISFKVDDHDKIAIIGVNGAGKTTILNILIGEESYDSGDLFKSRDLNIGYLKQHHDLDMNKTIYECALEVFDPLIQIENRMRELESMMSYDHSEQVMNEYDSLTQRFNEKDGFSYPSRIVGVLKGMGFVEEDFQKYVHELSGGQKTRLCLAKLLLEEPKLLVLDEPTNHLDIDTIAWLTNFLKSSKKTVLFITHDRYFLDSVATRIFELDQANLIEYQGNYQDYVRLKAEQDERDAAALHKKKQLYKQELGWMRTQPQARATKQQARINRFKELKGEVHQTLNNDDFEINFETSRIGKKVVNFEHVDFDYEDDKPILSDFNLIMQNRDRIGIVGDNGVGKSTLLNLINGDLVPTAGVLDIGETVRIGYFSQQIKDMDESKRVINYLQEVADEVKTTVGTTSITELLEQFLFPRSTHGTQIAKLSGGEKKRLYLLKILIEKPNVLLLDEPTNDLDIATLTVLENFLNGFGGPVVTVSHDRYFLDKVANKILAFEEGGVREFFGNYTDYLDEKAFLQEQSALLEKEKEQARVKVEKVKEDKRRMSYFEKQEWATIEDEITDLEAKIEEIEAAMLENASDYGQLASLQRDLDTTNETLLEKYERYEYLSGLKG